MKSWLPMLRRLIRNAIILSASNYFVFSMSADNTIFETVAADVCCAMILSLAAMLLGSALKTTMNSWIPMLRRLNRNVIILSSSNYFVFSMSADNTIFETMAADVCCAMSFSLAAILLGSALNTAGSFVRGVYSVLIHHCLPKIMRRMKACSWKSRGNVCCASCGKAEVDEIKLKGCDKCDLARQQIHEAICARVAELLQRDEILFRQSQSSCFGDCPICFLPMPLDPNKRHLLSCCCKVICIGCDHANNIIRKREQRRERTCPFCRKPVAKSGKERETRLRKRAEANDLEALRQVGRMYYNEGDYDKALKYWEKAAESGDAIAHGCLSIMYRKGEGVEKSEERELYHAEEAAIAGHLDARHDLAMYEFEDNRYDRAVKHLIIAANLGHDKSLQELKECYKVGDVSKDDYASALRAHQAAVDATKSPQREAAGQHQS